MPADQDGRAGWKRCRYVDGFIPFLQWPFFDPGRRIGSSSRRKTCLIPPVSNLSNCVAMDPENTATLAVSSTDKDFPLGDTQASRRWIVAATGHL